MREQLVTQDDIRESERLRKAFEAAKRERQKKQVEIDRLQASFEEARLRQQAAATSFNTPAEHLAQLTAEADRLEMERDRAIKAADGPLKSAHEALSRHTGRFTSAAMGWLGWFARTYDFDRPLCDFVREVRLKIDKMLPQLRPLPEVAQEFEAARKKIEGWSLAKPPTDGWYSSRTYPGRLSFPAIQDFIR